VRLRGLALAALVTLTCCSGASAQPAAAKPAPTPPAATGSPLAIPPPTMPFVRCDVPALEMQLIKVGAATGNVAGVIEVRNKSGKDCDLYGYAGVEWLDAAGASLPTRASWSKTSFFINGQAPEEVVGLPAGTPPINPLAPVPGHAYIPLSWNDVVAPCVSPVRIRITPPDARDSVVIDAAPPGTTPGQLDVCSNGAVTVNPTRVASY
jgi:Protein of unknown function (DUF4232)